MKKKVTVSGSPAIYKPHTLNIVDLGVAVEVKNKSNLTKSFQTKTFVELRVWGFNNVMLHNSLQAQPFHLKRLCN